MQCSAQGMGMKSSLDKGGNIYIYSIYSIFAMSLTPSSLQFVTVLCKILNRIAGFTCYGTVCLHTGREGWEREDKRSPLTSW